MKKRTIIYIACAVAISLIIAFGVYFAINANKNEKADNEQKIIIEKYDDNFDIEKTIEITDKNQIKELNKICKNPTLEQDDTTSSLGIRKDVKVDFGNGKLFIIQLDLQEYCHYEDLNTNTNLRIKMPEGLFEKVNNMLLENK